MVSPKVSPPTPHKTPKKYVHKRVEGGIACNTLKRCVVSAPAASQGATIQVSGAGDSSRVRLVVLDDGPGFSLEAIRPEHGLGNLIARLELLFGNEGRLDVTRENGKTAVSLSFPC